MSVYFTTVYQSVVYALDLQFCDKDGPNQSEAAIYIRVHTPLHRQANGRPIAIVSVVDNVLATALGRAGKADPMHELEP